MAAMTCCLHVVGEGVAVDGLGVEAGGGGFLFEGDGVVPAGGAGALVGFAGLLEEHADGGGVRAEGRGDPRGEAVAGGGADHQHRFGPFSIGPRALHHGDLLGDVRGAAFRVGGGADESTDLRCNDHMGRRVSPAAGVATVFAAGQAGRDSWIFPVASPPQTATDSHACSGITQKAAPSSARSRRANSARSSPPVKFPRRIWCGRTACRTGCRRAGLRSWRCRRFPQRQWALLKSARFPEARRMPRLVYTGLRRKDLCHAPTSGLAIASLVCGIMGLVTCLFLPGIPAVICGHMALSRMASARCASGRTRHGNRRTDHGIFFGSGHGRFVDRVIMGVMEYESRTCTVIGIRGFSRWPDRHKLLRIAAHAVVLLKKRHPARPGRGGRTPRETRFR